MEKKVKQSTENFINDIRRKTRRIFSSEQKIMIVMEAQLGESSVAEICRKHSFAQSVFKNGIKSLWKLVKKDWPVIQPEKQPAMKWPIFVKKING